MLLSLSFGISFVTTSYVFINGFVIPFGTHLNR